MANKNNEIQSFSELKSKDKRYLKEIQVFLDIVDNIENEELKNDIIYQMLKCDKVITQIAEEKIEENSIKNPQK